LPRMPRAAAIVTRCNAARAERTQPYRSPAIVVLSALLVASVITIVPLAVGVEGAAQQRASPHESVSETVDGAALTITYGRPFMRGRAIFGALVPYGRVWCPGADEATVLDSDRALRFGELTVPAGPHTIWMLPTAETWTLIVSTQPSGFHTRYPASSDLGRLELEKRELPSPVEQLTFAIRGASSGGGTIAMRWATTEVSAPFTVVQ
jgi:DUF2911 family protein